MNSTQTLAPVNNDTELQARLSGLPTFSTEVYDTLHKALYAEPFSQT